MAKKSFRKNAQNSLGGLSSVIQNTTKQPAVVASEPEVESPIVEEKPEPKPRPKARAKSTSTKARKTKERSKSEEGCKDGDTRKTFIIRKELAEKMQDIAYWEPGKLKDHMNAALEAYVKKKWTKKRPKDA